MKLLGRKKDSDDASTDAESALANDVAAAAPGRTRTTAPKGRPTPKRDTARRRGPVAPAPMTAAEARARRKAMARAKLTREERRADKAARRAAMTERRERMMAGEEGYLLPRDRGPVRRFVRDIVDARRNALGLFMPATLTLLFMMFAVPQLQMYMSPAMMLLMVVMAIDGVILGRKVANRVDEKFPGNTESRWKLGWYAFGRASQLRRMRAPRPQVKRGSRVD
ncbi:MAG TPA: DUF3043 domain-containing protein [Mycobacterium sp.]|uniref:DUF3043 domain-containing protein n=1 Tax=Mycobacterium sp. TaxID=1785 RepID=UPI002D337662|nr:DUF3043 domain-containing protein [Mycobacterium sp.]HZU47027.1 DUF3043 domain-containing protein [Mycobacterium sp.]